MARKPYPSDLTDGPWALIEEWIPPAKPGGRPREGSMRDGVKAILYVLRTEWRLAALAARLSEVEHRVPLLGAIS